MELFVLRHGHAVAEAPRDSLRELSSRGRAEVNNIVQANLADLKSVRQVLVSPYLRAQQTANIALDILGEINKEDTELLVPGAGPGQLIDLLCQRFRQLESNAILLVSHQPLVGVLVDDLCSLESGRYRMGTASLAAVDVDVMAKGCCSMRWLRHPSDT